MPLVPARVTVALVAVLPEQLDRTARAGYPSYFWSQVRNSLVIALPSQGAAAARPDAVERRGRHQSHRRQPGRTQLRHRAGRLGHYHSWQGNFGLGDWIDSHAMEIKPPPLVGYQPCIRLHARPRIMAARVRCYPCRQCSRSPGPGSLNPLVQGSTSGAPPAKTLCLPTMAWTEVRASAWSHVMASDIDHRPLKRWP